MAGTQDVIPSFNQNLPNNKKSATHSPGASVSQNFGEVPGSAYGWLRFYLHLHAFATRGAPAISTLTSLYHFFYSPNMQIHQRGPTSASAFIHWPSNVASPNQCVSNFSVHQTHLGDSYKHRSPRLSPRIAVDLGWNLIIFISNKFPGDTSLVIQEQKCCIETGPSASLS